MRRIAALFGALAFCLGVLLASPPAPAYARALPSIGTVTLTAAASTPRHHLKWYMLHWAETQAGKPYIYGGTGPGGYDCSGLVMVAWSRFGKHLPRTVAQMLGSGKLYRISARKRGPGDLVAWGTSHVEIVTKRGSFGAHHTGTLIGWRSLYGAPTYWRMR